MKTLTAVMLVKSSFDAKIWIFASWKNIFKQKTWFYSIVKVRLNDNVTWGWLNMVTMRGMDYDL